jgi:hypothetical protein
MIDPITIAAGVSAFKLASNAISTARKALETADDVGSIAGHIDTLLSARASAKKSLRAKKNKKKPTRLQKILRIRTGDSGDDDTSIATIANEVLEKKKLDRQLENLAIEIDNKFGRGTWDEITEVRKTRIQAKKKAKEQAAKDAKIHEEEQHAMWMKVLRETGKLIIFVIAVGGMAWWLWTNCEGCG